MKRDDHLSRTFDAADGETQLYADYVALGTYQSDRQKAPSLQVLQPIDEPISRSHTRYCDRPMSWSTRLVGLSGTAAIFGLVLFAALFTLRTVYRPVVLASQPLVVELRPLAAPPEPVREVAPGPAQVERQQAKPEPQRETPPPPLIQLPTMSLAKADLQKPVEIVDPGPPRPETSAPKSIAAPIVNRLSNDAKPDWESLILAHLERFRQYPARARAARQQGIVYIRFTMNRAGMVLSSTVARKSGSFTLDQAALDTLLHAQPLPAIPQDRPDVVELTIPVEFSLR